jgi:hypothetical protein
VSESEGAAPVQQGSLAEIRSSARGWHSIQLAVLGFIGLCGVIQGGAGDDNPEWLRQLAAALVVGALVLSCTAVAMVGTVAWPVDGSAGAGAVPERSRVAQASRRLRVGIALTFVAVAALAAGATSSWWPDEEESPSGVVEVSTRAGVLCGELAQAAPGSIAVDVGGRSAVLPVGQVLSLRSVAGCG